jgi:hypothetical protein
MILIVLVNKKKTESLQYDEHKEEIITGQKSYEVIHA